MVWFMLGVFLNTKKKKNAFQSENILNFQKLIFIAVSAWKIESDRVIGTVAHDIASCM